MTPEQKELEALQLIQQTVDFEPTHIIAPRCGCIETNGRLFSEDEYHRLADLFEWRPGAVIIHFPPCQHDEGCKEGKYPKDSYPEPHCHCYQTLKGRHGEDALPECTKQYAGNPMNGKQ